VWVETAAHDGPDVTLSVSVCVCLCMCLCVCGGGIGLFLDDSMQTLESSALTRVVVTNSIQPGESCSKLKVLSVAPFLAEVRIAAELVGLLLSLLLSVR
jgi:hypothetical protein